MTLIFHSGLSKDLSIILNDADDFNVTFQSVIPKNIYEEVEEFHYKANWIDKKFAKIFLNVNDSQYKYSFIYRGIGDQINDRTFKDECTKWQA
ncbi:3877_t:CDS:2 [Funneliformis geosporum]|nr:3877_t:CDS:2 [Funneliformis geosporum]